MPPRGMVTTSMKLWTMVLQVTRASPSPGPPYCWSTAFMAMIITLSMAMMTKGVKPMARTRPMTRRLYRPKVMGTGARFPSRKATTKAALAAWLITVAMAAPRTPMSKVKMNRGSRTMFRAAPSITEAMPTLAKPWQITSWLRPVAARANRVPLR